MIKIENRRKFKIPVRIIIAAGGLFTAAFFGWMRFVLSLINWDLYQALGVQPGVWYLLASGLISGLVYTLAGMLVLIPNDKWKKLISVLLISGLTLFWIDRICFARSLEAQPALPFSLVFSAGLTILAFCLLFWNTISIRLPKWKD